MVHGLSPAYDLVATQLLVPEDDEELALHLNGKKKRLKRTDFIRAMKTNGLNEKVIENMFEKFSKDKIKWNKMIERSFVATSTKKDYQQMIAHKFKQIGL